MQRNGHVAAESAVALDDHAAGRRGTGSIAKAIAGKRGSGVETGRAADLLGLHADAGGDGGSAGGDHEAVRGVGTNGAQESVGWGSVGGLLNMALAAGGA